MARYRFKSDRSRFLRKNAALVDMIAMHMGQDIEIQVKTGGRTPFNKGPLRDMTTHRKVAKGHVRAEVPVEYAAVQEKGQRRGAGRFVQYTTPGTGPGFFKRAIESVLARLNGYVEEAARAAGLK